MTQSEHTPGPWEVNFVDDPDYECGLFTLDNKMMVEGLTAEHYANAYLMEAAPELLEALKLVRDDVVWMKNSPTLKMIKKVIAKAT